MPNNYPKAIPDFKQSMKTISMFKDEYLLDTTMYISTGIRPYC